MKIARVETAVQDLPVQIQENMGQGEGPPGNIPQGELRVSVRNLVEFILRHGDIDNRHRASPDNAMQEGGRIHRMIQRRMGAEYQAEVSLKLSFPMNGYALVLEGRADGIIRHENQVTIDEIKGTYRELIRMQAPAPLHLAQAKCYAYMYGAQQGLSEVRVRMTYCHIPTGELRYFHEEYSFGELERWFKGLIEAYGRWTDYLWEWRAVRQGSIEGLEFPFPYREGQKELAAQVYRTIYHKKKLFLEAPTGVGKTISTLYPSIQAMGRGMGEKIFYLTAKTITGTVADGSLKLLRTKGLKLKSLLLTAKEKICFMDETECNPEYCPYARGHYDRINEALFALLMDRECFDRESIEEYARKYMVCPFEMGLDMSLFADAVICDYNYLFDPHVYLKRFFGEGTEGNYIFLVDEAHNLLERGREMYSAVLRKEDFTGLVKELKQTVVSETRKRRRKSGVSGQLKLENLSVLTEVSVKYEMPENGFEDVDRISTDLPEDAEEMGGEEKTALKGHGRSVLVRQGYADKLIYQMGKCSRELLALKRECEDCRIVESIESFVQNLMRLQAVMEDYLEEQEEGQPPVREQLLEFYFEICHFLMIYDLLDENYVKYTQLEEEGGFRVKLLCVDPGENLGKCMRRGRSTILFSATLLPIQYYKKLLGGEKEDYEVYARSVFNPAKRALLIACDVTSKYTRRSEEEYCNIARYIEEIVKNRHGNYMVFCPSYSFLHMIYDRYVENYAGEGRECILQEEGMTEEDREKFLSRFQNSGSAGAVEGGSEEQPTERFLIGFCVLGGIFSEGIDLKNDSLIGAIIVGTGLPQVSGEKEILRGYFEGREEDGFDYAYRYPGMNKVLQAAGRVIRTVDDVGIVALLDERFLQYTYRRLFPREWEKCETVSVNTVAKRVERFWDEWL